MCVYLGQSNQRNIPGLKGQTYILPAYWLTLRCFLRKTRRLSEKADPDVRSSIRHAKSRARHTQRPGKGNAGTPVATAALFSSLRSKVLHLCMILAART